MRKLTEKDRELLLAYRARLEAEVLPYRRRQLELALHPERRRTAISPYEVLDQLRQVSSVMRLLQPVPEERIASPPTKKLSSPEDILRDEVKRQQTIQEWRDAVAECDATITAIDEVLDAGEWNPELNA